MHPASNTLGDDSGSDLACHRSKSPSSQPMKRDPGYPLLEWLSPELPDSVTVKSHQHLFEDLEEVVPTRKHS